jgi:hypothetical protein
VVSLAAWLLVGKLVVLPRVLVEVQRYSVAPETVFDSLF